METLILYQHPSSIRESTGRNSEYSINRTTFDSILSDFSQLKINGELLTFDIKDFQNDLLRNNPTLVIDFIEKSDIISLLHPYICLILLEVLKKFLEESKIIKEFYCSLCINIIEKNYDIISKRYSIIKVKKKFIDI